MSKEEIAALDAAIAQIEKVMGESTLSPERLRELTEVLKTLRAMREEIARER